MTGDIIERMRTALRDVINAYGDRTWGTVHAMERALPDARAVLAEAEKLGPARIVTDLCGDGERGYFIPILDQPKEPTK